MPRLGEHLVAAGLLTVEQVEQALRAQVVWGGRLGTNLIELHYLELDPLSKVLGRQLHMPAALSRHFEKADRELQRMLAPELAERFSCVPLVRMGSEPHVVIAALGPVEPRPLAVIADALGCAPQLIVPAVAAELRIRYQLERVYGIRRAARFLRARGKSIPPLPAFQALARDAEPVSDTAIELPPVDETRDTIELRPVERVPPRRAPTHLDPDSAESPEPGEHEHSEHGEPTDPGGPPLLGDTGDALDEPDDAADRDDDDFVHIEIESDDEPAEDEARARERRTYVRTIDDAPSLDSERHALLGRIAIRKVAVGSAPRIMAGATLGEATRAIRRGTGRDRVGDLIIDTLDRFAPACDAAILLVIRGATAIGWKGFQRGGGTLGEIAVPLDGAGLIPSAVETNAAVRKPCGELEEIDRLLLASLGQPDRDLVVVPIAIARQVMCVIALAAAPGAQVPSAETVATAAGAAFARLIRDASR